MPTIRKLSPMEKVERMLQRIEIPKTKRKGVSEQTCRTVTIGQVNQPFHKFKGHSKFTEMHPELWQAVQEFAQSLDPEHRYTSVTINHNVLCNPHRDKRNDGTTLIIGLGDYTGGELVIDEQVIDINHRPHYFNGHLHTHYNKPWTGDRWSLMFYSLRRSWDIVHREEDIPIIREVFHGNQYHRGDIGFGIEKGEHWLDIGAHIGCWTKKCHYYGATTDSYEPDPDNYALLIQNSNNPCHNVAVGFNAGKVTLHKGTKSYFNKVSELAGDTDQVAFGDILIPDCCIKMDIEGAELPILDHADFTGIKKMVLAYHINCDHSRTNFLRRMDRLRKWFNVVHHQEIKQEHMNFFPNEIIVYCKND